MLKLRAGLADVLSMNAPTTTSPEVPMTTTTPQLTAADVIDHARLYGFTITARNLNTVNGKPGAQSWIVEVSGTFNAGDVAAYGTCESAAFAVLRDVPRPYPGSVWGSTSDGVGGHAALTSGNFHLCVSGVAASFAKALAKATR